MGSYKFISGAGLSIICWHTAFNRFLRRTEKHKTYNYRRVCERIWIDSKICKKITVRSSSSSLTEYNWSIQELFSQTVMTYFNHMAMKFERNTSLSSKLPKSLPTIPLPEVPVSSFFPSTRNHLHCTLYSQPRPSHSLPVANLEFTVFYWHN